MLILLLWWKYNLRLVAKLTCDISERLVESRGVCVAARFYRPAVYTAVFKRAVAFRRYEDAQSTAPDVHEILVAGNVMAPCATAIARACAMANTSLEARIRMNSSW